MLRQAIARTVLWFQHDRVKAIHRINNGAALEKARTLWDGVMDANESPATTTAPSKKAPKGPSCEQFVNTQRPTSP